MPRGDEISATLLKAASDLLASEGASALTVRRIAADAGVSTMNVYSRFGNKDGVVEELFIEGFIRLAASISAAAPTGDPMRDLLSCGGGYRTFALANPTLYGIMFQGAVPDYEPSEAALEVAHGTLQQLADKLSLAMDAGRLVAADPLQTAACIWGLCHGIVSLELKEVGGAIDWSAAYDQATTAMLAGMTLPDGAKRVSATRGATTGRRTTRTPSGARRPSASAG